MRAFLATIRAVLAVVVAFGLAPAGCGGPASTTPPRSGAAGTASGGAAGAAGGGAAGARGGSGGTIVDAGGGGATGMGGSQDAAGSQGGNVGLDAAGNAPDAADGAASGWAGIPGIEDLSTVKPADGCGQDPGQMPGMWVSHTITTPMTRLGSIVRTYYVKLPGGYDKAKAYRLIYEGAACGGGPLDVPDFAALAGSEGVIQIALQRRDGVHTDGPGGPNCFDDWNTMSIEYPFFEAVHMAVNKNLCFDQHRVFVSGHSSGAWLTNNLGCEFGSKYIRAISPHEGGFSQEPNYPVYGPPPTGTPTCSDLPTPGLWQHNHDDANNPISANIKAITRALRVNKCTDTDFAAAKTAPYAAPGTNGVCKQFTSCPKEFPIVFCDPQTGGHTGNMMWAAAWQFYKAF